MSKGPLNDRQRRFAEEYATSLNASDAYRKAGYKSDNSAAVGVSASRLLSDPRVADLVAELQGRTAKKLDITREKIARELAFIAFADIRDFAKWGNSEIQMLDSKDIPDEHSRAIAEVATTTTGTRVKLHDKRAALMDLAKLLDLMPREVDPETLKGRGSISIKFGALGG